MFQALSMFGSKPAILSLINPYSDMYVPQPLKINYPLVLTELRCDKPVSLNYAELLDKSKQVEISVTEKQAKAVEMATREQSGSKVWFRFRAGRITASKMKPVCATNPDNLAQSLIKAIVYPESNKFKTNATQWGCDHEKTALDMFVNELSK